MKKILHLICNSHIDPVWQWDWDEGASAALSTFYAACNLLDKYDFIFCHNEVLIYEYIEKYDPELFKRIQKLVEEGKWKIMGGWYCQPDCLVPSGESFLRQISLGREYFLDKFNARPTVALNFDSFGHTKGLPQILRKTGYDSYIFCRPLPFYISIPHFKDYPHGSFLWEGYDGTRIKALRYESQLYNYTSPYGEARKAIENKFEEYKDLDIIPVLWGVGNHGGTSSEKDLEDIIELQNEKKGEWEIIHSSLEDYFATQHPIQIEKRYIFVFSKAYSSVSAIKLAHDQLENALYRAERICTLADLSGKYHYNKEVFKEAEKILCQIEFHDVLAGTAIKTGIDSSLRKTYKAIEELNNELFAAYYALSVNLKKVKPGDDNVVIFNPYPYEFNGYVEAEFYPAVYTENNNRYVLSLYDINDQKIDYQIIKEESNIATQHRVRLLFKVKIPAFSLGSYRLHIDSFTDEKEKINMSVNEDIVIKDKCKTIVISRENGLISSYKVDDKEYLNSPMSVPMFFNDNSDPWGWRTYDLTATQFSETGWPQKELKNSLSPMKLDNRHKGSTSEIDGVSVVENGQYLTEVQVIFQKGESKLAVNYKIYKDTPYIDINYHVLWGEHNKGLKIKFPLNGESRFFSQMAFGIEKYSNDGVEYPTNRYVGVNNGDKALVIYNRSGIHSASKKGRNLYLTLLNGASYCAHPTFDYLPLTPKGRYDAGIEQGAHDFSIRISVNKIEECEKISKEFNEPLYGTIFFPHGNEEPTKDLIKVSNRNIVISALKRRNDGTYLIRLYNGNFKSVVTELEIKGMKKNIHFGKFEFKTFIFDGNSIKESSDSSIY
ncbi:MAG: hypothetical protein J6M95_01835 [Bacilli bacterium]|nr:hypothetical protein [Bacilli bacterium]